MRTEALGERAPTGAWRSAAVTTLLLFGGVGAVIPTPNVPNGPTVSARTAVAWEVVLSRRLEFRGQSGALYSFSRLDGEGSLRPIGVTYVIAEATVDGWRLLRVGHTNNLAEKSWAAPLAEVREAHPSAELLIRLNVSRSIREVEAADLAPLTG